MATSMTKKQTATQAKANYGNRENPLTPLDALTLANCELERLSVTLEDLAESSRTMIQLAQMNDEHREYATMLRIFERVLNAEFDSCSKASERVQYTIWQLKEQKASKE